MAQLSDEAKILNRYAQYCFAADDRSREAFGDCWTEDGTMAIHGEGDGLKGREAVASLMDLPHPRWHFVTHVHIEKIEADTAAARAYFLVIEKTGELAGQNAAYGRFFDKLKRCADGEWRWSERVTQYAFKSGAYNAFVGANFVDRVEGKYANQR